MKKRLGEILVEGGLLSVDQLEEVLPFQKKSSLKLGQFLVREGIVSESQIVDMTKSDNLHFLIDIKGFLRSEKPEVWRYLQF